MNAYDFFSTIVFGFLFLIWKKDDVLNTLVKASFMGFAFWGALVCFGKM